MKNISIIFIIFLSLLNINSVQAVSDAELEELERKIEQQEAEAKANAEAVAKRRAEAKRKAEEQAKKEAEENRRAEENARLQAEAKAKRLAEEEARQKEKLKYLVAEMIKIPGGNFQMGSNTNDPYRTDEHPIHTVSVPSFYIAKYEVTQTQWMAVTGNNPSYFKDCDECPVEQVSWEEIQNYIEKLNKELGEKYRLPSEAEWEYACRSGGKQEQYCGGNDLDSLGWNPNNTGGTKPVGLKQPNSFGLYDMTGNVYELVQDCWNHGYRDAPADGRAWLQGDCQSVPGRGGCWECIGNYSTLRSDWPRNYPYKTLGFRLAKDL